MKFAIPLILVGFLLTGCQTTDIPPEYRTQYVAIVPPDSLYQCPKKPAAPNPDTMTNKQAMEYLVRLDNGYNICSRSLRAIKAFADQANLSVQKNQPQ